jgi:hypothetical protein
MDEIRLKQLCESALDTSFSGVSISEFRALPTHKFDEELNEWIPDSLSLFIILKKPSENYNVQNHYEFDNSRGFHNRVENFLEGFFGFECCIEFL